MIRKWTGVVVVLLIAFVGGAVGEWMALKIARAADEPAAKVATASGAKTVTVAKTRAHGCRRQGSRRLGHRGREDAIDDQGRQGHARVVLGYLVDGDELSWGMTALDAAGITRFGADVQADGSGAGMGICAPSGKLRYGLDSPPTGTAEW